MKVASFVVGLLLVGTVGATREIQSTDFHCTWLVSLGHEAFDPLLVPTGRNSYMFETTDEYGLHYVLNALGDENFPSKDLSTLRPLLAVGNYFTGKMRHNVIEWLCRNEELDKYIVRAELDQAVGIGG